MDDDGWMEFHSDDSLFTLNHHWTGCAPVTAGNDVKRFTDFSETEFQNFV